MILIDYHTHNARCGHAQGQIEDYIQAGIRRGLREIGISDHCPIYWKDGDDPQPNIAMAKSELPGYVAEVLRLKAKYADQINVRLGLEVDYIEGDEDACRAILADYAFDYLIGSVHFSLNRNVYDNRRWDGVPDVMAHYEDYYRLIAKSAHTGIFDVIAHATAITAYAPKPIPAAIEPLQDAVLQEIRAAGVAIEINTSGYRKMTTDPFPTPRMVAKAAALGIPITYGSDSHRPDEVHFAADKAAAVLEAAKVTELATFEGRQRKMVPVVGDRVYLI